MTDKIKSTLFVRRLYRTRWFWTILNTVKDLVQRSAVTYPILDDRNEMEDAEQVLVSWPDDYVKPKVGLVQDINEPPYWTKYERFLRNNQICFEYYDIHRSNWLDIAHKFDVIIWPMEGAAPEIEEHKRKIYILEKYCNKDCFPSFETAMWNEDKIFQYEWLRLFDFPVVETFVSHSASETLEHIQRCVYPLVTKVYVGAGSLGVELVKNKKQANKIAGEAFSPVGRKTYWPYFRQKGYIYFQKLLQNTHYDLRVIGVGNKVFGYYRDIPSGDFRASGMGLVRKGALPEDAVRLAMELIKKLDLVIASVDILQEPGGKLQIIEVQANITVETPGQLHVDGIPGAYVFNSTGEFHFEPCKYWIQELALKEFFERLLLRQANLQTLLLEK
jgi:glutathione synthase/RimK-type ligase-like ATP-grasp enzyme